MAENDSRGLRRLMGGALNIDSPVHGFAVRAGVGGTLGEQVLAVTLIPVSDEARRALGGKGARITATERVSDPIADQLVADPDPISHPAVRELLDLVAESARDALNGR